MMGWGFGPYVSVAERRQKASQQMNHLRKKGMKIQPVEIEGRTITSTFWGQSWCQHLESFSDFANRLPRGRTYVRNGSVCHLEVSHGKIKAIVSGSDLYDVNITISVLPAPKWETLKKSCSGKIGSLIELLQGRLSNSIMSIVTNRGEGLFPLPAEINLNCSCPDWATMCKHVAAVMYGVGARLDEQPELLFVLRGVDHEELIEADVAAVASMTNSKKSDSRHLAQSDLEDLFGIEMLSATSAKTATPEKRSIKVTTAKRTTPSATAANSLTHTGKTIRELRDRLGMSQSQLAQLIGVNATTISVWEKKKGPLNVQPRNMSALDSIIKLSKKRAWAQIAEGK